MSTKQRRVTIRDVARRAGVSSSTVSLVLQKSPRISDETRLRVGQAIRDLGYRYNRGAANLRRGDNETIGLVVDNITNPFFSEVTAVVSEIFSAEDRLVLLADSQNDAGRQHKLLRAMAEHGAAGLLISMAVGSTVEMLEEIVGWGIPTTMMVRTIAGPALDFVGLDNPGAMALAVDHLVGLGHRRIAFLGGMATSSTQIERLAGYRDALERAGIAYEPRLVTQNPPTRRSGADSAARLMSLAEPPTAMIGYNDIVALSAMHGLREIGLVPGRDISVVGIDDIAEGAYSYPGLTTIRMSPADVGRRAAMRLKARIDDPGLPPGSEVVVPSLVRRDSSRPPP